MESLLTVAAGAGGIKLVAGPSRLLKADFVCFAPFDCCDSMDEDVLVGGPVKDKVELAKTPGP